MRLRHPSQVMRLARLGSFHQSRLSFMRSMLRCLKTEGWTISRPVWEVDDAGVGHAIYTAKGSETLSLVAFAHDLPDHMRSDRVIATAWDATFALFDGVPNADDIARLSVNVPKQEAGRITESELSLSRANRSVRLWKNVVDSLARGEQPDRNLIESVGYLMRTTAVYGSGKFGAADRCVTGTRPFIRHPFRMEMLSVYLTRLFVLDLVEHMARARNPSAAPLSPAMRQLLGIGNSTGLGMAPFLANHPRLLNQWITKRETALARVLAHDTAEGEQIDCFLDQLDRAIANADGWNTQSPYQIPKTERLRTDLRTLRTRAQADLNPSARDPWRGLLQTASDLGLEAQEQLVSLLFEPFEDEVDPLAEEMSVTETMAERIDGTRPVTDLKATLATHGDWALQPYDHDQVARCWYTSEEKLEPRLGQRHEEPIADYEQPLDIGRRFAELDRDLPDQGTIAEFLDCAPQHRLAARRLQILGEAPYSEIRDNLIDADMLPLDMLRCKLSFFGATRFDPRSDRWLRITMFQNAPLPADIPFAEDNWTYPAP